MRCRPILVIPMLILILVGSLSCGRLNGAKPTSGPAPTVSQQAITKIHGAGKITADSDASLAFKSGGKIVNVLVAEGDMVHQGDKLAALDTSDFELLLSQAQVAESQAQVNISQAQVAASQAQVAKTQAEAALTMARFNLDKTKAVSDIKDKITDDQMAINTIQVNLNTAQAMSDSSAVKALTQNMASYQRDLTYQQIQLAKLLSQDPYTITDAGVYINGQKYDRMIVEDIRSKQLQVESAQGVVEQSDKNLAQAQLNIDLSQKSLAQAQKSVNYYRQQINDSTLTAPFNGIIVSLNVQKGDIIPQPSVNVKTVMRIIDPATMESTADIDEEDIARIKSGQTAEISLKSLPGTSIRGKVTKIGSIPKTQLSGEIDYAVTIDIKDSIIPELKIGMSIDVDIPVATDTPGHPGK